MLEIKFVCDSFDALDGELSGWFNTFRTGDRTGKHFVGQVVQLTAICDELELPIGEAVVIATESGALPELLPDFAENNHVIKGCVDGVPDDADERLRKILADIYGEDQVDDFSPFTVIDLVRIVRD